MGHRRSKKISPTPGGSKAGEELEPAFHSGSKVYQFFLWLWEPAVFVVDSPKDAAHPRDRHGVFEVGLEDCLENYHN